MNLAEIRFQSSVVHGATVASSAPRVPRQTLVAYEVNGSMTIRDQVLRDFRSSPDIIAGHTVVLFRSPIADDVISQYGERDAQIAKRQQHTAGMSTAQNNTGHAVFSRQCLRKLQSPRRDSQVRHE